MEDVDETMKWIQELVSIPSPTGYTENIIRYVESLLKDTKFEIMTNIRCPSVRKIPADHIIMG
ncbi:MAG: hypothetical protein IMW92_01615 [Bacillales bacterium]|nr:hypothetical protein [Bacillales bacterium]